MKRIFDEIEEGTFEIMCHPGYVDEILLAASSYVRQRETELEVWTDPLIKASIKAHGIELITFENL